MLYFKSQNFSGLPYQAINKILSLNLCNDEIHLSAKACGHIFERHPDDFTLCFHNVGIVISEPEFAGYTDKHPDNFTIMKALNDSYILAAIEMKLNHYGKYPIQSMYLLDKDTMNRRLRKGFVKPLM